MRSLRFVVSRRWALFALAVVVLAYGAWLLGQWQFHRLEDRKARNAVVERNEALPPAPVAEILDVGVPVDAEDEWRVVTATGTYAVEDTVIIRYRTREGASGVDVVVPLVTADGPTLLVDRGWVATDNRGMDASEVPDPPAGEVTVTGWVRADATGDSTKVSGLSSRSISSVEIGRALDREVYRGFVDLRSETPEPEQPLAGAELPELNDGPHFFYGLQWWFFGALAIFGFFYLLYDEWRGGRSGERRGGRSPGTEPTGSEPTRTEPTSAEPTSSGEPAQPTGAS
ncbi:SURF1 family protein [Nocardioides sp.]|uniref:SURF1 family cytochrome oxidase biogenesis protein n=1 Tax=Nocardioides sp. TaxID=35761 RepID=UPI003562423C